MRTIRKKSSLSLYRQRTNYQTNQWNTCITWRARRSSCSDVIVPERCASYNALIVLWMTSYFARFLARGQPIAEAVANSDFRHSGPYPQQLGTQPGLPITVQHHNHSATKPHRYFYLIKRITCYRIICSSWTIYTFVPTCTLIPRFNIIYPKMLKIRQSLTIYTAAASIHTLYASHRSDARCQILSSLPLRVLLESILPCSELVSGNPAIQQSHRTST